MCADARDAFVLIHGFSASPVIWSPIRAALEARGEVVAVTLDGHAGGRPLASREVSVGRLVDGVEREMDAAGLSTAVIVGNSLGGWIALELARRGRARAVVALAPGGAWEPGSETDRRLEARLISNGRAVKRLLPVLMLANRWPRLRRAMFAEMIVHGDRIERPVAATMLQASAEFPWHRELAASMFAPGNGLTVEGISCPVLLGWGTEDRLTPAAEYGRRLRRRMPQAFWCDIPGAGHIPMFDAPDEVTVMILEFAERL